MEIDLEPYFVSSPSSSPTSSAVDLCRERADDGSRLSQSFRPAANAFKRSHRAASAVPLPIHDSSPPALRDRQKTETSQLNTEATHVPLESWTLTDNKNDDAAPHVPIAKVTAPPEEGAASTKERGFGRWTVDKRTRKRIYVSLSGRRLNGREAMVEFRKDQLALSNPAESARKELEQLTIQFDAFMSSNAPFENNSASSLSFWGIPEVTVARYEKAGIKRLFEWQVECLLSNAGKVLRGGNLVYTAPTSGGKTLVAEILMLRRLARGSGTIFFVVPFVALVEEKADYLREVWQDMFVSVKVFHSEDGGDELPEDTDVCVCTIEKANMLFNGLLERRQEHQVSMLIIDEMVRCLSLITFLSFIYTAHDR